MKKLFFATLLFCFGYFLFANNYKINGVIFDISGKTKVYRISENVPVDTNRIFTSLEELEDYINDYSVRLSNTRNFSFIDVKYEIVTDETVSKNENNLEEKINTEIDSDENELTNVVFIAKLVDSSSLLALPYPKFDSNTGISIKIKAKDSNFLGSMNTMSADLNFQFLQSDIGSSMQYQVGGGFSYDHPFKIGPINTIWVNDYQLDYTFGYNSPEWNAKTGFKFHVPTSDKVSVVVELYQYAIRNTKYALFDDQLYFREQGKISLPLTLSDYQKSGKIVYTPFIDFNYNWDYNGIMKTNDFLTSPTLSVGHVLQTGRVDWNSNMRKGFTAALTNYYLYNFQRNNFIPYIGLDLKGYYNFRDTNITFLNRFGICGSFYGFIYVPYFNHTTMYGEMIGGRLRGIRDEQLFSLNTGVYGFKYACNTSTAVVINIDVPIHLFTTNFQKSFLRHFNFDLQLSPFVDIALGYNYFTNRYYNIKDGFYAGGFEFLAYLLRWPSFTLRGSLGFDLGRISKFVDSSWRSEVSKYEISIGIGLQY